jgi:hypothetical protein
VKSLYIAGPMTGLPESNYPAFHDAARVLRGMGYTVENPAENPRPPGGEWVEYMRMSLRQLSRVDALVMLPGWQNSRGARIEVDTALKLGLNVFTFEEAVRIPVEDGAPVAHHPV